MRMTLLRAAIVGITITVLACGGDEGAAPPQAESGGPARADAQQPATEAEPAAAAEQIPTLSEEAKSQAIEGIKVNEEVIDAIVFQSALVRRGSQTGVEGKQLNLTITVTEDTSRARGRALGAEFVRLVKSFGPGPEPGDTIGTGVYDYTIAVYWPELRPLAEGTKDDSAEEVAW